MTAEQENAQLEAEIDKMEIAGKAQADLVIKAVDNLIRPIFSLYCSKMNAKISKELKLSLMEESEALAGSEAVVDHFVKHISEASASFALQHLLQAIKEVKSTLDQVVAESKKG